MTGDIQCRSDVRVRATIQGGDGTGTLIICDLAVQLLAQAEDLPPDPLPDPPEEVPSACATTTDTFDGYTDSADLLATYADSAGYPTNPASYITLDPTGDEAGGPCVKVFVPDVTFGSAPYVARTVTGLTPGATAVVTCRGMTDFNPLTENSAGGLSVGNAPGDAASDQWQTSFPGIGVWRDFSASHVVQMSGAVWIAWGFILSNGSTLDRNGYMNNLTLTVGGLDISLCGGSGGGEGEHTGGGDEGEDPVPTPVPATGDRPFAAFAIPSTGAGIWDTCIRAPSTPANCVSILNSADASGIKVILSPAGTKSTWTNPDGTFNKGLYKAKLDALKANGASDTAITNAIASGLIPMFHAFDEPYAKNVYGGVQISATDVDWACGYIKSLWPGCPVAVAMHVDSYPNDIPNCDVYWSQYSLTKGDVTHYRDSQLALAASYGKQVIMGINVIHFTNPGSGTAITADQLRHYGGILASTSVAVAFAMWKYTAAWYNGTGIAAAVAYVQGIWESFDP